MRTTSCVKGRSRQEGPLWMPEGGGFPHVGAARNGMKATSLIACHRPSSLLTQRRHARAVCPPRKDRRARNKARSTLTPRSAPSERRSSGHTVSVVGKPLPACRVALPGGNCQVAGPRSLAEGGSLGANCEGPLRAHVRGDEGAFR